MADMSLPQMEGSQLYGGPAGNRIWEYDQANLAHSRAQTEELLARAAGHPSETRLRNAQAGEAEHKLQQDVLMGELSRRAMENSSGNLADDFRALAGMAAGAAMPEQGLKILKGAAEVDQSDAAARSSKATTLKSNIERISKEADLRSQIFGGVKSAQGWEQAKILWQLHTGTPSPYQDLPYDAAFVGTINQEAINGKERADLDLKRLTQLEANQDRDAGQKQRDAEINIARARLLLEQQKEERLKKNSGNRSVSVPQQTEVDQAKKMLDKQFPKFDETLRSMEAFRIASEARELHAANPSLGSQQALQQAFNSAIAAGRYETGERKVPGTDVGIPFTEKTKPKEAPGGRAASGAVSPPPSAPALPADRTKWEVGNVYNTAKGVGVWDGKQFNPVPKIKDEADYNKLPSGAIFMDPEGKVRKKK